MSEPDRVLVTGASGFVGSAVARKLVERGYAVRALVRATSPRFHLEGLPIEFVEGDLRRAETVRPALVGVRHVFHVAADYRLWARDPNEILANNLESTRIVMEEALRAGVERVVYTSSVATLAVRTDGTSVDETFPLDEAKAIGAYKRSKVAAERLVERMIAEHRLPAVIVNPSTPIGPRDVKPTPTGRIIVEAARGRMPAFVDTGLNLVHVDDVAAGHLAALDRGKIGERYVLGGHNVSLAQMLGTIATLLGRASAAGEDPARRDRPVRARGRDHRAFHRPRAVRHHGRAAHVEVPHVLHHRESGARARDHGAALYGSARRCHRLVPRRRLPQALTTSNQRIVP